VPVHLGPAADDELAIIRSGAVQAAGRAGGAKGAPATRWTSPSTSSPTPTATSGAPPPSSVSVSVSVSVFCSILFAEVRPFRQERRAQDALAGGPALAQDALGQRGQRLHRCAGPPLPPPASEPSEGSRVFQRSFLTFMWGYMNHHA
jgi:hypothetical protein